MLHCKHGFCNIFFELLFHNWNSMYFIRKKIVWLRFKLYTLIWASSQKSRYHCLLWLFNAPFWQSSPVWVHVNQAAFINRHHYHCQLDELYSIHIVLTGLLNEPTLGMLLQCHNCTGHRQFIESDTFDRVIHHICFFYKTWN